MAIDLLGPLRLDEGAVQLGHRDRVVLSALAMRPGEVVTTEQLADALWGDEPPATWRKNLQNCVVRLRRALGADAIETTADRGYRLALAADRVDAQQFERTVTRGSELLTLGEFDRAAYTLAQGLALWRGRPLAELDDWEPGRIEADRLAELRLAAEELWLEATLAAGQHREVLARGQAMVRAAPLREERWRLLALAQYQSGRQSDALRTIQQVRRMLAEELGLDPGPELERLEQAVLRQDPGLLVDAVAAQPSTACPYRGLSPYGLDDAEVFFGREDGVASCTERLQREGVVVVVGPSGSGKSSLVRAGIAAALRASGQAVDVITPGAHPLDALPHQERRAPGVLVVDQCEEVFTLCDDEDEREAFLDAVVEHATHSGLVVALRADRMGEFTGHAAFAHLVERGLYLIPAMSEADLRAAIEGPARQSGLVVEPGLVDLLVREVEGEPGALPLLSHVLRETWLRRESRSLTVAGYQACGGIRGAVAQSAEEVYRRTEPSERHVLRDILLRLVAPGADGEPVRTRVPLRQVSTDPAASRLVEMLVAARLVTSDDGVYEIAHEALARAWPRLRGWLDDDVQGRRLLHHLTGAADAWDQLGEPDSELYRGARLQRVLDWLERTDPDLTAVERAFLDASQQHAQDEARSAAEQARQQSRMIRRLRLVLTGACVLLGIALTAGGLAVHQRNVADESSAAALASETAAVARQAGANALLTADIDSSILLAIAAVRLDDSPETRSSLLAAIGKRPELVRSTPLSGDEAVDELDVTRDGRHVVALDQRHHLWLYEAETGRLLADSQVGPVRVDAADSDRRLAVSPNGGIVAVATTPLVGPPLRLLDAPTLRALPSLGGLPARGWMAADLAYSGTGRYLAALLRRVQPQRTGDGSPVVGWAGVQMQATAAVALVWDLTSPQRPIRVPLTDPDTESLALDHGGEVLYTSGPLTRHDLVTGRTEVLPLDASHLELSPDGQTLAGVGASGALLLDAGSGRLVKRLAGSGSIDHFRFSNDGSKVAGITFADRAVETWRVESGELVGTSGLTLDRGESEAVDFGADDLIYAAGAGQALRRWDVEGKHRFIQQVSANPGLDAPGYVLSSPDGHRAAYLLGPGVTFADLDRGTTTGEIPFQRGFRFSAGAWSADGRRYATAVGGWIRVWDVDGGRLLMRHRAPAPDVTELDYSPDGSRLVVSELSGRVTMFDAATLEPLGRPADVGEPAFYVTAGPDNRTAFVLVGGPSGNTFWSDFSKRWALVDLESGTVLRKGELDMGVGWAAEYSPDGDHAAVIGSHDAFFASVGGSQTRLLVIDLRTGTPVRPAMAEPSAMSFRVAYSPDGSKILTSSTDGSVSLWDASSGRPSARLPIEPGTVGASFLPDGHTARIVGWYSGIAYDWDTDIDSALDFACTVVGRELTEQEWRDNFGDRPYQRVCDT